MREARPTDIDALLKLENECYPPNQAYARDEYRYALGRAKAVNLIWQMGPAPTGFIGAFHHATWRVGHIYTVNVHPSERGKGLGVRLMDACHEHLRKLGMTRVILEVNVENESAIRLYDKCGYERIARLKDYYTQYAHPDAFRYEREL